MKTLTKVLLLIPLVAVAACTTAGGKRDTHEGLDGTLWMQTSAEYKMLVLSAYRLAKDSLAKALEDPTWTAATEQSAAALQDLPPAIIVDIDETVLDNSRFQAQVALERRRYDDTMWQAWVKMESAEEVPGAAEFINWASQQKQKETRLTVFYITNRDVSVEAHTKENLRKKGFPLSDQVDAVISKGEYGSASSDKGSRRKKVSSAYRVLLIVGDDLGDFIGGSKDTPENRVKAASTYLSYWGERWILLPNPLYGSWERAAYDNDFRLTDERILERKFQLLKGFR